MPIDDQMKIGNAVRVVGRSPRIPDVVYLSALGDTRYLETVCEIAMAQVVSKSPGRSVLLSALRDESGQQVECHDLGTGYAIPVYSAIDGKSITGVNISTAFRLLGRLVPAKGWTEVDIWMAPGAAGKPCIPNEDILDVAYALTAAGFRVNFELSPEAGKEARTVSTRTVTSPKGILKSVGEEEAQALIDAAREVTANFVVPHWLRSEVDDVSRAVGNLIATLPMLDHATVSRELSRYGQGGVLKVARHLLAAREIGAYLPFRTVKDAALPSRDVGPNIQPETLSDVEKMFLGG